MKKGQWVTCKPSLDGARYLTEGKKYWVIAHEGFPDITVGSFPGDKISKGYFVIESDSGMPVVCREENCVFGEWEVVEK